MDSTSLEGLATSFNEKLENLRLLLDLKYADDSDSYYVHMQECEQEVDSLEVAMALMKVEISFRKEKLNQFQETKCILETFISSLQDAVSNIPTHMPRPTVKEVCKPEMQEKKQESKTSKSGKLENPVSSKENCPPKPSGSKKQKKNAYLPALEFITVDEFEAVPKYMKGRMTYTQVNTTVEELNKAYKEKYKVMGQKVTSMNDVNRKRYDNYKMQETKDTKGEYFIVEGDIKEFTTLKVDKVCRSIITVLRHCGRLKEIRGGGKTRYACLFVY